jgi:dTDP-4-dehydrorhamnose reductase
MNVIITGANGQVGKSILMKKNLCDFNLVGLDRQQLDITDSCSINKAFQKFKPIALINSAAFTNVDLAETYKEQALLVNFRGVKNLANLCRKFDIPLFHISTDYVFDGYSKKPYTEVDTTNPINNYGSSKLMGEKVIQKNLSKYIILRTSWVFSELGSNFLKSMINLANKSTSLNVVDDQIGGPTSSHEIAEVLIRLVNHYLKDPSLFEWGIYNFSGYPYVSWHTFAEKIFSEAQKLKVLNKMPLLKPISGAEFQTKAKRPSNSSLDCSKINKFLKIQKSSWESSLNSILKNLD